MVCNLRARLGVVATPDAIAYVTGGWRWAK
jgi:hypothetical protein